MKLLVLVSLLIGLKAQAVVTADCPALLQYSVSGIQVDPAYATGTFSNEDGRCLFDCYNDEGLIQLGYQLKGLVAFDGQLKLVEAQNAICRYESNSQELPVFAEIRGTFNPGSKDPAHLRIKWSSAIVFVKLKSMAPESIVTLSANSKVYYQGEYCSYGDCSVDYIQVGVVQNIQIKATK